MIRIIILVEMVLIEIYLIIPFPHLLYLRLPFDLLSFIFVIFFSIVLTLRSLVFPEKALGMWEEILSSRCLGGNDQHLQCRIGILSILKYTQGNLTPSKECSGF